MEAEVALDVFCVLAFTSKSSIVDVLQTTNLQVTETILFPTTVLLRNLALSSQDKALISAPSASYTETETEQLRQLMQLADTPTRQEPEELSALIKRQVATCPLLAEVLATVRKNRKTLTPALLRAYVELVFGLGEVKEIRPVLVSNGALEMLLKSTDKALSGHAVARLLLTTDPVLVPESVLQDCVVVIHSALTTSTHQLTDLECALALVNLSGHHATYQDLMISLGTHRRALDLLSSSHPLIQKTGLELLCNLSASEKLHMEFESNRSMDILQVLTGLLNSADEYTSYLAVSALANLGPSPHLPSSIRPSVQSLLSTHPSDDWTPRLSVLLSNLI